MKHFSSFKHSYTMASHRFYFICLLSLIFAFSTVQGQRMPFKPSILGSEYEVVVGNCVYPQESSSKVSIGPKSLWFVPSINNNRGAAWSGSWFCPGYVQLFYNHHPDHMWIHYMEQSTQMYETGVDVSPCPKIQKMKSVSPWGPTRSPFITQFKKMQCCDAQLPQTWRKTRSCSGFLVHGCIRLFQHNQLEIRTTTSAYRNLYKLTVSVELFLLISFISFT